jgi:(1->4)-alpha-D-glucan 1-alpha-D-glucosylmutase
MPDRPLSTYRLQLGPSLGFNDTRRLVRYLVDLGVTHLYLSPILTARQGSPHGYDVVDCEQVADALGGEIGLRALADAAHDAGLGIVVDIVPNHVGVGPDNVWWEQLLAEGQAGPAGRYFDVDWDAPLPGVAGKVILPVLGDQYGAVLLRGEIELVDEGGVRRVRYHEHSFPLSPESRESLDRVGGTAAFRGEPGRWETWSRLHGLLESQHYRLVHRRAGNALINYRRFFAVDELAAVRVQDDEVFEATHGRVLTLVAAGVIDGLRVDHPDGLWNPSRYLRRLAERSRGVWTVVEKILQPGEVLRDWPVAGTTGYDFLNDVLGLAVDPAAAEPLAAIDREFGGADWPYATQVVAAKRDVIRSELLADARRLAGRLWALTQMHPEVRDVDDLACLEVVARTAQAMDIYRTYVDPDTGAADAEDERRIDAAINAARQLGNSRPDGPALVPAALHDFFGDVLAGRAGDSPAYLDVAARFQQLSSAVMAKGVEDTALYRYRQLVALAEVGGDPARFGITPTAFHDAQQGRARRTPAAMITTATHDAKRGEDVRLRIAALSEVPKRWRDEVVRWAQHNHNHVRQTPGGPAPDPATEYLLYQTLVGVWPLEDGDSRLASLRERVSAYLIKATREAGQRTAWIDPNEAFEAGVTDFVAAVLDPDRSRAFLEALARFAGDMAEIAMVSGLGQVLLRATSPGVADTYQGNELWDDSLVDPDNRRPVDFGLRRRLLTELDRGADPAALWASRRDGRVKLWVLSRALRARREHPEALGPRGQYVPLGVSGRWAEHVVAFARVSPDGSDAAVTVTPRLAGRVMGDPPAEPLGRRWADTAVHLSGELPPGGWRDLLTGAPRSFRPALALSALLGTLPVALLVARDRSCAAQPDRGFRRAASDGPARGDPRGGAGTGRQPVAKDATNSSQSPCDASHCSSRVWKFNANP